VKPFLALQQIRMRRALRVSFFMLYMAALFGVNPAFAQLDPPEEIVYIDKTSFLGDVQLETTIYKPPGAGPFPLVIINHGKQLGNPHLQKRFEPLSVALYFVERGYVVFVPMRHGFSKSGGEYQFHGNSAEMAGRDQVRDIDVAIQYAHTLAYVKKDITLVVGYSEGGWVTLAYGASKPDPSVRGLINFSGGVRDPCCIGLLEEMIDASKTFGRQTTVASIWFYGDNDSLFNRYVSDRMFANYARGNPNSRFIPYGNFSTDAHLLFMDPNGRVVWEPFLTQFLYDVQAPYKAINPPYKLIFQKK
jgi:dienelactone hydrolase